MVRKYLIPIQSFTDIITNSSSETYIVDTVYTAEAMQDLLDTIHKQNAEEEHFSGECCGVIVHSFKDEVDALDEWELEEAATLGMEPEDYILSYIWEDIPDDILKSCLFVRVNYGYTCVNEFLLKTFRCIYSDHCRETDETGRIIAN